MSRPESLLDSAEMVALILVNAGIPASPEAIQAALRTHRTAFDATAIAAQGYLDACERWGGAVEGGAAALDPARDEAVTRRPVRR